MVEREAFLVNPKQQDHVFKYGGHDSSANNKENGDYYEHPSFSYFMNEL